MLVISQLKKNTTIMTSSLKLHLTATEGNRPKLEVQKGYKTVRDRSVMSCSSHSTDICGKNK